MPDGTRFVFSLKMAFQEAWILLPLVILLLLLNITSWVILERLYVWSTIGVIGVIAFAFLFSGLGLRHDPPADDENGGGEDEIVPLIRIRPTRRSRPSGLAERLR